MRRKINRHLRMKGLILIFSIAYAAGSGLCAAADGTNKPTTHPDWSGVWALPDSAFVAAMGTIAHGNGPQSPSYVPGYPSAHGGANFGAGGSPPGPALGAGAGAGAPHVSVRGASNEANAASCLPNGVPAVMGVPVGYEFLLTPGLLTILIEEGPTIRQVHLDGRSHTADADLSYTGESIGHWEGQTLVVDTTAISPKAQFFFGVGTSGKTHLMERIHLIDHDHLRVDTEVSDPVALQKPWHYSWTYVRTKSDFEANICDKNTDRDRNGEPDLTPPPDALR